MSYWVARHEDVALLRANRRHWALMVVYKGRQSVTIISYRIWPIISYGVWQGFCTIQLKGQIVVLRRMTPCGLTGGQGCPKITYLIQMVYKLSVYTRLKYQIT